MLTIFYRLEKASEVSDYSALDQHIEFLALNCSDYALSI